MDLPSNCGGVCACTTCHVWIEAGLDSLSELEDREDDKLQEAAGLSARSRLACQAKVGARRRRRPHPREQDRGMSASTSAPG